MLSKRFKLTAGLWVQYSPGPAGGSVAPPDRGRPHSDVSTLEIVMEAAQLHVHSCPTLHIKVKSDVFHNHLLLSLCYLSRPGKTHKRGERYPERRHHDTVSVLFSESRQREKTNNKKRKHSCFNLRELEVFYSGH